MTLIFAIPAVLYCACYHPQETTCVACWLARNNCCNETGLNRGFPYIPLGPLIPFKSASESNCNSECDHLFTPSDPRCEYDIFPKGYYMIQSIFDHKWTSVHHNDDWFNQINNTAHR